MRKATSASPPRKVETAVIREKFNQEYRDAPPKFRQHRRNHLAGESFARGEAHAARERALLGSDSAFERVHLVFDASCDRGDAFTEWCREIAALLALEQRSADSFLQLDQPPHYRRLVDAERLRRAQRGAGARDSQDEAEIRPIDHAPYCKNAEWIGNIADC